MPPKKKTPKTEPENTSAAPEVAAEKPVEKTAAPAVAKVVPNGKKILIVEDERPLAHALAMKLTNEGYQIQTVTNGTEALEALKKDAYGLVLLDLIMPQMDGFTVMEQMKATGQTVPVIVLSNLGQDEDRTKAKSFGVVDYFVKSNTPIADIVKRVKTVLA